MAQQSGKPCPPDGNVWGAFCVWGFRFGAHRLAFNGLQSGTWGSSQTQRQTPTAHSVGLPERQKPQSSQTPEQQAVPGFWQIGRRGERGRACSGMERGITSLTAIVALSSCANGIPLNSLISLAGIASLARCNSHTKLTSLTQKLIICPIVKIHVTQLLRFASCNSRAKLTSLTQN
jgi:hypothetical protein